MEVVAAQERTASTSPSCHPSSLAPPFPAAKSCCCVTETDNRKESPSLEVLQNHPCNKDGDHTSVLIPAGSQCSAALMEQSHLTPVQALPIATQSRSSSSRNSTKKRDLKSASFLKPPSQTACEGLQPIIAPLTSFYVMSSLQRGKMLSSSAFHFPRLKYS